MFGDIVWHHMPPSIGSTKKINTLKEGKYKYNGYTSTLTKG